ncbi:hypothetical protein GCM10027271_55730 [Saccharopolyspora gloriosae]|uniref:Uncharacterized protein n=1 Tax=Saccharopolyspora gloriosae TaxID=455344 RepID=A0A840NDC4_9PSEU|nr:hypothetical protein [Saccharopolyspora gloriosae]MBB5068951.1 hypothetical protein [Saccharopolyspora gloriosae]
MKSAILHDGITHGADVSWLNGQAISLCGKSFGENTFTEKLFHGSVNCPDCKHAKRIGKRL